MNLPPDDGDATNVSVVDDAAGLLLRFGTAVLRAGGTATRARELIEIVASKLDVKISSVALTLETLSICVQRGNESTVVMRDVGLLGVNAWRIAELEKLAGAAAIATPSQLSQSLAAIENSPPRHSSALLAAAVGIATGGFAFLNGALLPEMIAAACGGGMGQLVRSSLSRRVASQVGTAAVAALTALIIFVLISALTSRAGFVATNYQAGFISAVLFLIPGVPLVAGLFDLLQHQTIVALSRMAHAALVLLAVASGLSIVAAIADLELIRRPAPELEYALLLGLRAAASFVAACAFAMLFNSSARAILAAGLLAVAANSLRLLLVDTGMALAPAAFIAACLVGIVALSLNRTYTGQLMAICAAPLVIMIPGLYAFEFIVLLNKGQIEGTLQAFFSCAFVICALAMGLGAARLAVGRK